MIINEEIKSLLVASAIEASKQAYAPYSNYPVGAALLTLSGSIVTGCNVENASYGLCICAERTAIVKAVSQGERDAFPAIAVYAPAGTGDALPCGACRQFLVEFNPEMLVLSVAKEDKIQSIWTAAQLLPNHFGPSTLNKP